MSYVEQSWAALPSHRDADVAAWAEQVTRVVAAAQQQSAADTIAVFELIGQMVTGERQVSGVDPADFTTTAVRGTPAAEVYARPGTETWTNLAQGKAYDVAVQAGQRRAVSLATTDLQLARTHAARRVAAAVNGVVGYRRTLTGAENCALCLVASTQRYTKGTLLPIHPGCDCGVAPIFGDADPGQVINRPLLERTHEVIGDTFGGIDRGARQIPATDINYRDVIVVHEHGEIGPVLSVRGHDFTGPADF